MPVAFDSKEVKKNTPETMLIELVDQRDGGWVMNGTRGTKNEVRLQSPSAQFIANRGFRLVKVKNQETGETEYVNEAIRYIQNCPVLSVEEQNKRGFKPAKNKMEDLILVKNGNLAVTREGAFKTLFDYLKVVFYNDSNPDAPSSSKKVFREVETGKKEEAINEIELAVSEAIQFIGTLYTKIGKEYRYNEEKINALCQLFLVYAESPSGKVNGLIAHAKKDPVNFLDKAMKFEQTLELEIGEALDLGVILFKKNVAMYATKDKVIADLGGKPMKHEKKISTLASLFGSDEYKAAYEEFSIELEAAKEKQFKA